MNADSSHPVLTFRCSTVFVSEGGSTRVFRSLDDVPASLRERMFDRVRRGSGSATILIANRGGREQLARRLRGLPSSVQTRLEGGLEPASRLARGAGRPKRAVNKLIAPRFQVMDSGAPFQVVVRHASLVTAGAAMLVAMLLLWR